MTVQKYLFTCFGKNVRDVRGDDTPAGKCFPVTVLSSSKPEKGTEVGCFFAESLQFGDAEDALERRIPDRVPAVFVECQDPVHAAVDKFFKNRFKIGCLLRSCHIGGRFAASYR